MSPIPPPPPPSYYHSKCLFLDLCTTGSNICCNFKILIQIKFLWYLILIELVVFEMAVRAAEGIVKERLLESTWRYRNLCTHKPLFLSTPNLHLPLFLYTKIKSLHNQNNGYQGFHWRKCGTTKIMAIKDFNWRKCGKKPPISTHNYPCTT